jgi:benzoate-CoA ligase
MSSAMNAAWALLRPNLERNPDKDAYWFGSTRISYRGLWQGAARFGNVLRERGVAPGDRVLLVLPDSPAAVFAFLGTMLVGAVAMPVGTTLGAEEYAFILADSGAVALATRPEYVAANVESGTPVTRLFCDDHGLPAMTQAEEALEPLLGDPNTVGFMLYTSGSTGKPKGVPHRHADLLVATRTWGQILGITPNDILFSTSKMSFAYGLLATLALPLPVGATAILYPDKPEAYDVFTVIAERRPSVFFGVPTLYNMMIRAFEETTRVDSLRLCFSAGEALPPVLFDAWKRLTGLELLDGIGSTEACNVFISNRPNQAKAGTSGQVVPGFEVRIVDDAGLPVASGTSGHLLVRGESFARSYWNRPEKTRETMLGDGFVHTGDVYVEQDGFYSHQGRSDDMIKVGAQWISPVQIEEALLTHPGVAEAAVAGCRVEGLERPCAFVIPCAGIQSGPALSGDLRRHLKEKLPRSMCPVRFEFPATLPKTATGKIQRFKLRQA